MKSPVHILATCNNSDLLQATTLVFRTLRTGFPTAQVWVWGNQLPLEVEREVKECCTKVGATFAKLPGPTSHDLWIEQLLYASPGPFWICDTDMVFFASMEAFTTKENLAGRYEPRFTEPWTKTIRVQRLHTCLLWLNAPEIRTQIRLYLSQWHPKGFPFAPEVPLIRQTFVPRIGGPPLFYDTCAGLYHAIGGEGFGRENDAFEHLHCGTYSDQIQGALPGIKDVHARVFENPELARGLRLSQEEFYKANT